MEQWTGTVIELYNEILALYLIYPTHRPKREVRVIFSPIWYL